MSKSIVIVGGGISGLSAAYYIQKYYNGSGKDVTIRLIEAGNILGGKIQTLHRNGFILEKGPDSFLTRKMAAIDFIRELGIENELVAQNPQAKKTYILHKGKLHRLPPGLMLGIPTQLIPFMKSRLISVMGKIRAAMDLFLPRGSGSEDESLGRFLERRLGKEVVERIADPLLAGIYAGDTYDLSIRSTFPQFAEVEKKHRSLILGMLAGKKIQQKQHLANLPKAGRDSLFLSFRNGLNSLVMAAVNALDQTEVLTGYKVSSIEKSIGNKYILNLKNELGNHHPSFEADAIILAVPTFAAAKLLSPHLPVDPLVKIPYVSVANVIMAFDLKDIKFPLDGSGFVIPRQEGRFITACTWVSSKWTQTAPKGKALLRCYVGRAGEEQWMNFTDEELLLRVRQELESIMGISAKPLFYEVTRWKESMPQYAIGHLVTIKQMREQLASVLPGIFLAGSGYHGVGIPDCIRQGKESSQEVITYCSEE